MRLVPVALVLVGACAGPPASPTAIQMIPPVECVGIPAGTCQEIVADARRNAQPGTFPVHIRATCAKAQCTIQEGEVDIEVLFSDGHRESTGRTWSMAVGGAPPPTPAVAPSCQGVPLDHCSATAIAAGRGDQRARVVASILVRCTHVPCTASDGAGDMVVTYADGTSATSQWSYGDGVPSDRRPSSSSVGRHPFER